MSFIDFARSHGVEIDPSKLFTQKIVRTGTVDKPKSDNGAFFWDGKRGWVMNWSTDSKVHWYGSKDSKPWTAEEKREWGRKKREQEARDEQRKAEVMLEAAATLRLAKPNYHDYWKSKGFEKKVGLVVSQRLVIPMYDCKTNVLQGYQSIYWDEESQKFVKKMLYGMTGKGAVFWIGDRQTPEVWLVEGIATGESVYLALKSAGINGCVCVCFGANNVEYVAQQLNRKLYIFADNDASKTGEKIALKTGLPFAMSPTVGQDANDFHQAEGLYAVQKLIQKARMPQLPNK